MDLEDDPIIAEEAEHFRRLTEKGFTSSVRMTISEVPVAASWCVSLLHHYFVNLLTATHPVACNVVLLAG